MKALTVKQPWAGAIVAGVKKVENRTRRTHYRGPLVIHSGKAIDEDPWAVDVQLALADAVASGIDEQDALPWFAPQSRGLLLGMVDVVDCHAASITDGPRVCCGPWAQTDVFHWVFENPRRFRRPLGWSGMLGLWDLPDELLDDLGPVAT